MAEQTSKRKGCIFYGCITAIVLFVVTIGLGFFLFRVAVNNLVKLTDEKPKPLPVMPVSDSEWQEINSRITTFTNAYEKGEGYTLVLDSDQLNSIIAKHPEYERLREKVFFTIERESIRADLSIPMSDLPLKKVKNRFLNASAEFKVGLKNGKLELYLQDLDVKGKPLEDKKIDEIVEQNLADQMVNNPQLANVINKLESVEVRDGQLYLKTRSKTPQPAPSPIPQ